MIPINATQDSTAKIRKFRRIQMSISANETVNFTIKSIFKLVVICWLVLSPALAQTQIKNDKLGFSLELQKGWQNLTLRNDFVDTYLRAASPEGVDTAAVYVQIFSRKTYELSTYQVAVRRYIEETMKGTVVSSSEVEVKGQPAWRVEYIGNGKGYTEDQRHYLNTVVFKGDKIYVVHCVAEKDKWDDFKEAFEAMSNTLEIGGQ